jgi:hypothetical protein
VDYEQVDPTEAKAWTASLEESLKELRKFATKIRELPQ